MSTFSPINKLILFWELSKDGSLLDLKRHGYGEKDVGKLSFADGILMHFGDYGNFVFGQAAKQFHMPFLVAKYGAGFAQIIDRKADWGESVWLL